MRVYVFQLDQFANKMRLTMRSNFAKSQTKVQSTLTNALQFYGAAKAPIKYDKKKQSRYHIISKNESDRETDRE